MPEATEFDPSRPSSAVSVIRTVLFDPRGFYEGFSPEGSVKEPTLFLWLVCGISAVLYVLAGFVMAAAFGEISLSRTGLAALQAVVFAVISPALVGAAAVVYLLSVRTFLGRVSGFSEVYRMLAYACSTMILAWVPVVNAIAFTYALMVVMGIAVKTVFKIPTLTAVVVCLVAYVPVASVFIWVRISLSGLLFQ